MMFGLNGGLQQAMEKKQVIKQRVQQESLMKQLLIYLLILPIISEQWLKIALGKPMDKIRCLLPKKKSLEK